MQTFMGNYYWIVYGYFYRNYDVYFIANFNENFDGNLDGNFDGNFNGNFVGMMGILMEILMGIWMMDSMGWPYDSFDCLSSNRG